MSGPYIPKALTVSSFVLLIGWLVFILFYALWWSSGYSLFQNVIVTIVSFLVMGLLVGLLWVVAGPRDMWRSGSS